MAASGEEHVGEDDEHVPSLGKPGEDRERIPERTGILPRDGVSTARGERRTQAGPRPAHLSTPGAGRRWRPGARGHRTRRRRPRQQPGPEEPARRPASSVRTKPAGQPATRVWAQRSVENLPTESPHQVPSRHLENEGPRQSAADPAAAREMFSVNRAERLEGFRSRLRGGDPATAKRYTLPWALRYHWVIPDPISTAAQSSPENKSAANHRGTS